MNQVIDIYITASSAACAETYAQHWHPTDVSVLSSSAYSWEEARPLRIIDLTVMFASLAPMTLYSNFTPGPMQIYYTTLAPSYWNDLCVCTDLSQYVIMQEITKQPTTPTEWLPVLAMTIHYHFNTIPSAPPLLPFALNDDEIGYEMDNMLTSHTAAPGAPLTADTNSA
ncbi:hypothetical protein LXA43DRAFT_1059209 [Ganoderma leucocontextum]|nr:hypothetical protein LXA43DRAFT_1059209 [Ganoderma leucocontextum]